MDVTGILFTALFILNCLLTIAIIFLERRDVSTTWAWVLVLSFVPILGFILYLIFGRNLYRNKIFQWDQKGYQHLTQTVSSQMTLINEAKYEFSDSAAESFKDLIYLHLNNDEAPLTQNNNVEVFTTGKAKFNDLLANLANAKNHIHMQYYIFRNDDLGNKILTLLTKKASEGVKVRFLYDALGSRGVNRKQIEKIRKAGGEVEAFFPAKLFNLKVNYRNHRKLVIIDGNTGYIGGFNVGNEYLGLNPKFGNWRDTHIKIEGEAVNYIQTRFILDWNQASSHAVDFHEYFKPKDNQCGNIGIQIVSSGPDSRWEQIKNGYIKMILSAKKYVYIQTPYFIPDESLLDVLRIAALSGVDVRLMIPNKPDHPFVYWATFSNIGELLKAGAKVYIYENGFLHAKTIVIDDIVASIGTANIDVRSFRLNFEVNAFLYHSSFISTFTKIFLEDMKQSTELTYEAYQKRPIKIKFKESISRLLSPIL